MATNNSIRSEKQNSNHTIQHDSKFDDHVFLTYIDQWEKHSIGKIQLAAQQARNDVNRLFNEKKQYLINSISQINNEIQKNININSNFDKWTDKLHRLRQELSNIATNIHLKHDKHTSPIYLIKFINENDNQIAQMDDDTDDENINVPGTVPLTRTMLNNVTPEEQKQMLGERLFVLVQQIEPSLVAKITGMFLEWDNEYILILIKSHKILKAKIKEAIGVLQVHQYKQRNGIKS